jgi:hypothetical protein
MTWLLSLFDRLMAPPDMLANSRSRALRELLAMETEPQTAPVGELQEEA